MGRRMSHSVRRKKSKNEQFRMVVPADLRAMVGKTAWTESLGTTDPLLAAEKRGMLIARHKALIRELRDASGRRAEVEALALLDRAFAGLAVARGSMDAAVGQQLNLLATFVCDSWTGGEEAGQPQWWGDIPVHEPATIIDVVPSIDAEPERDVFRLRAEILEGRGIADGLVYQELATILLRRRVFRPIWFVVSYMRSVEPRLDLEPDDVYDAVAEAYLRKLAEHRFDHWPSNIHAAMIPFAQTNAPQPITLPSFQAKAAAPTSGRHNGLLAMPLTEACRYWQEQRRPGASAITEAKRAVARFVALFGDVVVGDITRDQVIEFRNLVSDIPPQTELARVVASGRNLRSVIDAARQVRREWEAGDRNQPAPDRLAPGSVKKDVGAISSILGKIQSDLGQGVNVAADIEIAGYSKTRKGQKRPRLPFTSAMMQTLFDSPLFTGCAGKGDAARAKPGPHVYQDELYWCLLFGVVGGPRLGEIGQIALKDIHECDLRRTYGDEFEGRCTYVHITGTGEDQHVKTEASERYVVIHERLIDLGFRDYVERRRKAGHARLFDLEPDRNGNFVKELSRRLNRYLDRVVTEDPRYVFHSTRHEFTDRADLSQIPTRVANSIKGHSNATEGDKYGLVSILHQHVHLANLKVGFIDWPRLIAAAQSSN
jgi:integrase